MAQSDEQVTVQHPDYETVIGIEIHVQLKTKSKIFCGCANQFGSLANVNICPICTGQPGTLPVLNRKVVDSAIMAGIATNCKISRVSEFCRKHYTYPDLPKNYQITQGDRPICLGGHVPIERADGTVKKIRLTRIHIEEDAGKNMHMATGESFVDINRAGTPLIEIVTEPDISNSFEARAYLQRLKSIMYYLGISDVNMEEGSFRGDINISVRKKGEPLGTRVELKNLNSFRFIVASIEYEVVRQINLLESGGKVRQETLSWDTKKQETVAMRSKEDAFDYRYIPDPDLPLLVVDDEWVERIRKNMPELPHFKFNRFQNEYGLSAYESSNMVESPELATYFEEVVKRCKLPKMASNWILRDVLGFLKQNKIDLEDFRAKPSMLAELIVEIDKGVINSKMGQEVFVEMATKGKYPSIIIQEKDLRQIGGIEELQDIVMQVTVDNQSAVADYRGGNQKVFAYLVGQAMKATKGKGNPIVIRELMRKFLDD
ncbi:Asp-tRNA(Asn)/Glu-tRNA(Gln) amidotransferase subunit GatB [Candidatus Babeliales bacterium]|nr:Asp-tRNA(Asn)/Glu-tRNA(Gln) amidotransferase subunit GatB [Candidatus Babeliales bacterium]